MAARLRAIKEELQQRLHRPIPEIRHWLAQVVAGYFAYHAVPTNSRAFRYHVILASVEPSQPTGRTNVEADEDAGGAGQESTGFECVYGPVAVTEAEVVEFGHKFDPQDMHTDPDKASRGPFGGLIASGWHTAALLMRLYANHYLSQVASLTSPGLDELRWYKPVRPGDELRIRVRILEASSRSKPDRGMVRTHVVVLNQREEVVMSLKAMNILQRRGAA